MKNNNANQEEQSLLTASLETPSYEEDEPEDGQLKMGFTEHLGELRDRIIVVFIALAVTSGVAFTFSEALFDFLTIPLHKTIRLSLAFPFLSLSPSSNPEIKLVFVTPVEAFWMHLKISIVCGFIVSSPMFFYQAWRFVSPGLLIKEKKIAIPVVMVAGFLFILGSFFCFFIVLPTAINFLLTYKTDNLVPMLSVGKYADFCLMFILAFGAIFEIPVVIVLLSQFGIVTSTFLAKHRKYAVIGSFILAAIITPTPDALNQTLMAVPMILLYEAGIWASKIFGKPKS
jgi:sec-independent protein translocase protein TatC